MSAFLKHFSSIIVISLPSRDDRRQKLLANLTRHNLATEKDITWFDAIDGHKQTIPEWWKSGPGAWGCRLSHLHVIKHAQHNHLDNVLIIEDDAVFHPRSAEWLDVTMPLLPSDWAQFYLGGQHQAATIKTSNQSSSRPVISTAPTPTRSITLPTKPSLTISQMMIPTVKNLAGISITISVIAKKQVFGMPTLLHGGWLVKMKDKATSPLLNLSYAGGKKVATIGGSPLFSSTTQLKTPPASTYTIQRCPIQSPSVNSLFGSAR